MLSEEYGGRNQVPGAGWMPSRRLEHYDYAQAGAYFITIATSYHVQWLGRIDGEHMRPGPAGEIVQEIWTSVPARFPGVELDAFIVMPNHLHGIILLPDRQADDPDRIHLGRIVRAFKGASTRAIRHTGLADFAWQADDYEHVIRNDADLNRIREYILTNPLRWALDRANPDSHKRS